MRALPRRNPSPLTWVLRGNLHECLIKPLRDKLESEELGVTVKTGCEVVRIEVAKGRVQRIHVQSVDGDEDRDADATLLPGFVPADAPSVEVDHLIVAANPQAAARLLSNMTYIVDKDSPEIVPAQLGRRARAEPILVLDLYLKRKVPGIPREHVSVWDSPINLTFLDISQVWDELKNEGRTVLTVAASNMYGFPEGCVDISLWGQGDYPWTRSYGSCHRSGGKTSTGIGAPPAPSTARSSSSIRPAASSGVPRPCRRRQGVGRWRSSSTKPTRDP